MSFFEPEIVPENPNSLHEFLTRTLRYVSDIQVGITYLDSIRLNPQKSEPHEVYTGLIVYADGTIWDPGSGEGLYVRTSTPAWVKL